MIPVLVERLPLQVRMVLDHGGGLHEVYVCLTVTDGRTIEQMFLRGICSGGPPDEVDYYPIGDDRSVLELRTGGIPVSRQTIWWPATRILWDTELQAPDRHNPLA